MRAGKYPWDRWLVSGSHLVLRRGTDTELRQGLPVFSVKPASFRTAAYSAAGKRQLKIKVDIVNEDKIEMWVLS